MYADYTAEGMVRIFGSNGVLLLTVTTEDADSLRGTLAYAIERAENVKMFRHWLKEQKDGV